MLYIIRGLPGSGKTTIARKIGCSHFEADMYFYNNGKYEWDPKKLPSAHMWCKTMVTQQLKRNLDVVVSNVFSKCWMIDEYIKIAKLTNTEYKVIKIVGDHGNIHSVPQEVIDKMKEEWEDFDGEQTIENL